MPDLHRLTFREPLRLFAALWPIIFLAPLLPRLPNGSIHSFSWRQELAAGLLLVLTLAFTLWKAGKSSSWFIRLPRREFWVLLPLASFVMWSAASMFWAEGLFHSVHYNLTWIGYLTCFILLRRITERPRLMRLSLAVLAVVVLIISIVSTIEFWSTEPDVYQFGLLIRRSTGLGEPLAITVPIFSVLALTLRKGRAVLLCGGTAVLAWLATLQSLERAPIVGLTVALILLVAGLVAKSAWRPRRPWRALVFIGVLLTATAAQSFLTPSTFSRFQQLRSKDPNTQIRFLVWAIGLEMLREHPVLGVGANNYEVAYPQARAQFSAGHPNSGLIGNQEEFLAQRVHNEYIQILAELGSVGFTFFLLFCLGLICLAFRALRSARNPLALGAVCSLTTFAISSGASSVSFRWFGSGLLFFFASAITLRFASIPAQTEERLILPGVTRRIVSAGGLILTLALLCHAGALGINSILRGIALQQAALGPTRLATSGGYSPESTFRSALFWNRYDGPTHFDFGVWLHSKKRFQEAVNHLRQATTLGFNSSTCYAFLAGTEAAAGDAVAAERTLSRAITVYPRSVFLRVRHAIALAEIGKSDEAARAYTAALMLNAPEARGWRQLMCFGPDSAHAAADQDKNISPPRELHPASWAYPAIAEHAARPPVTFPAEVGSSEAN